MATVHASPASAPLMDGYHVDQLLVTLRPSARSSVGREALEAVRSVAVDDTAYLELGADDATHSAVDFGRVDALQLPSALSRLERSGAIADVTPVRRPRQDEDQLYSRLPVGAGRASAAAFESFGGYADRPSDAALVGTVVLRARSHFDMEAIRVELLRSGEEVVSVESIPVRRLSQTVPSEVERPVAPWHLARIAVDRARSRDAFDDASGVRVAVLDTGIDQGHPLLGGAIDSYGYLPPIPGVASGARDILAHGTHVAGTIAAQGVWGDVEGVSRARLHIHKIFDDDVDGTRHLQMVDGSLVVVDEHYVNPVMYLRALAACLDNRIEVVNLSIGGGRIGDRSEQALYRRLGEQGQIVVAAMGNERRHGSPTSWPAAYPSVVAVGALDLNDAVASFSNGGDHIAVSAPGVDILATMPTYRGVEQWTGRRDQAGAVVRDKPIHWTVYRSTMRGTSMAAPQVAGAASLWVARHGSDVAGFRAALDRSSRRVSLMGGVLYHPDYGFGCLDVGALLA